MGSLSLSLKEIATFVVPAFVSGEILNGELNVQDVRNIATVLGTDVVVAHLNKRLKDVIKSITYEEVLAVYTAPNTRNKANVELQFQNALTTVLAKKVVKSTTLFGDRKPELFSYILSPAQRGLGASWFNLGVKTWVANDYLTSFKVKLVSDSDQDLTTATDVSVQQITSNLANDINDEIYVNASPYGLLPFEFSASNIATQLRVNNGDNFIVASDIPSGEFFTFSDSIRMVTGTATGNSSATASQVTSALNITSKIGIISLLTQITTTAGVSTDVVIKMTDPRIIDAFKKAQADITFAYADQQTETTKKFVSGGYLLYPPKVTELNLFLKLTGQTSDYFVELYDSQQGIRSDDNSEDLYQAITNQDLLNRTAAFYNTDNTPDSTKNIVYNDVLDAFLGYESTDLQDPATIETEQQLVTYLTTDKLYNAIRKILDSSNNVEATTTENNSGFNQGRGKLKTFLSSNKILPIATIISALTQIASEAIKYNKSTLKPEEVIRKTFNLIETNLDEADFPALQIATTGNKFYGTPSSTSVEPTLNLNERLVIIFAQQNGYKTLNIADNFKLLPLLIKVASSQTKNPQNVFITNQQENYGLKVIATTGCPGQTYVAPNGGIINLGTLNNMFGAYKANKEALGAGDDIIFRTFISTTQDSVINTAVKLDSLIKEFTLERIAGIQKNPVSKSGMNQFSSPTTLDDGSTNIASTSKFNNNISTITLQGYSSSTAAGHQVELNAFIFTCILVDISRSIILSVNKSRKVSELLNANPVARDRFFLQTPLVDNDHETLFRTLLSESISNSDDVVVKSWIGGKYIRGVDALSGINTAIGTAALNSKNLASAVDETSNNDNLTIGASGVIRKLAEYLITILNKEANINPTTKTVEVKLTFIDVAKLPNMTPNSHAIIVPVSAASSDDLGEFANRLTEPKYNELKLSGFRDLDIQNCVLAYSKTSGFDFLGVQYKFLVGKDVDGKLIFDKRN